MRRFAYVCTSQYVYVSGSSLYLLIDTALHCQCAHRGSFSRAAKKKFQVARRYEYPEQAIIIITDWVVFKLAMYNALCCFCLFLSLAYLLSFNIFGSNFIFNQYRIVHFYWELLRFFCSVCMAAVGSNVLRLMHQGVTVHSASMTSMIVYVHRFKWMCGKGPERVGGALRRW